MVPGLTVVGVGASAGGLEALRAFVSNLGNSAHLAFVVVQHLAPQHVSLLPQLLGRETTLPVVNVTDGQTVEGGTIYITPPNFDVTISGLRLFLVQPQQARGPRPSIDHFFTSLADDLGERAIAVVLSGTGSDGSRGVRAVKAAGGFAIAQDRDSAKYFSMPQEAIETGCVDLVLPPDRIARELEAIAAFPRTGSAAIEAPQSDSDLDRIIDQLRRHTRVDLSGYKAPTILRRIEARMAALKLTSLSDYAAKVVDDMQEAKRLCSSILINVTSFFRDPSVFETLVRTLPSLLESVPENEPVRAWVAGCSTGEEAYTIAMLLAEQAPERKIQIFATDIDDQATEVARRGLYHESLLRSVPEPLVAKYFREAGGVYQVVKGLRDRIVFARHDVVNDPPFLNLALVSCRNVLIYFRPELQAKVLRIFCHALRKDGLLLLGKSEMVTQGVNLFSEEDRKARLFRRRPGHIGERHGLPMRVPPRGVLEPPGGLDRTTPAPAELLRDGIVREFAPPSALVDADGVVLHAVGDVGRYLTLGAGKADFSVISLVPGPLRAPLRAQISRAVKEGRRQEGLFLPVRIGGHERLVSTTVVPVEQAPKSSPLLLIAFNERAPAPGVTAAGARGTGIGEAAPAEARVEELTHELASTREHLQTVVEELQTSNEELQALNEELQSSNEELQASNEELEAANEELQSTNEELITVNEEREQKAAELNAVVVDLENIQDSIDEAILVVDRNLNIRRFNSRVSGLIAVLPTDLGRSLTSIEAPAQVPDFLQRIRGTIANGRAFEREIRKGRRYQRLRILPCLDEKQEVTGAVVLYGDVTELVRARETLRRSEDEMRRALARQQATLDSLSSHVALLDGSGTVIAVNSAWRAFGVECGLGEDFGVGRRYADLCGRSSCPGADEALEVEFGLGAVLARETESFAIDYANRGSERRRWFRCTITPVRREGIDGAVVMQTDITREKLSGMVDSLLRDFDLSALQSVSLAHMMSSLTQSVASALDLEAVWVARRGGDQRLRMEAVSGWFAELGKASDLTGTEAEAEALALAERSVGTRQPLALMLEEETAGHARLCATGLRSVAVFPINVGDAVEGVLVCASSNGCLMAEEVRAALATLARGMSVSWVAARAVRELALRDAALRMAANGVMITDSQGRIEWVNTAFEQITGFRAGEVLGCTPALLRSGQQGPEFYGELHGTLGRGESFTADFVNRRRDGSLLTVHQTISPIVDTDGGAVSHYVAIQEDVTARKETERRLAHLALHDVLTGLPNRVSFMERVAQAIAESRRKRTSFALLFLDLDHFKDVNDTLGHQVGDALLASVGERLSTAVRETDVLARLGGDEFALLQTHVVAPIDAAALAERIQRLFSVPVTAGGHELRVTISIGITVYPADQGDVGQLLKNADLAMYRAKQDGRNTYRFFTGSMNDAAVARAEVVEGLYRALAEGELVLHYQPQFELATGRMTAAEALLRWQHPERGLIPPAKFIGVAEESGLIRPIGQWVLENACAQAQAWRSSLGHPLRVSVNLSFGQFANSHLADDIAAVLERTGLPPHLLELELTESMLAHDAANAVELTARLKDLGLSIAIDDFGIGYSSLGYLQRYAVDRLKIDQSFVAGLETAEASRAIVRAIIQMSRALDLRVLAEGVEEDGQCAFLAEHGCHEVQGFLLAKPLPADELCHRDAELCETARRLRNGVAA